MTLTEYLKKHSETEKDFADRAGIGRATVSRIKKNGARSVTVVRKVIDASGGQVTADDLMGKSKKRKRAA